LPPPHTAVTVPGQACPWRCATAYVLTRRHAPIIPAAKPKQAITRVFDNSQLIEKFCQWLQAQQSQRSPTPTGQAERGATRWTCNARSATVATSRKFPSPMKKDSTAPTRAPESVVFLLGAQGRILLSVARQQRERSPREGSGSGGDQSAQVFIPTVEAYSCSTRTKGLTRLADC
jgi:hypothetical protein